MNENKYLEQKNETTGENSFMKKLLKKRLDQKGLTLIELLAVIVILAIIAAIAIPAIGNLIENSRYNAVKADAITALNAGNIYFTENPSAANVTIKQLVDDGYLQDPGKLDPSVTTNLVTKGASGSGHTLTHAAIDYSGTKKVTFTAATLDGIQGDSNKGSGAGGYTISN